MEKNLGGLLQDKVTKEEFIKKVLEEGFIIKPLEQSLFLKKILLKYLKSIKVNGSKKNKKNKLNNGQRRFFNKRRLKKLKRENYAFYSRGMRVKRMTMVYWCLRKGSIGARKLKWLPLFEEILKVRLNLKQKNNETGFNGLFLQSKYYREKKINKNVKVYLGKTEYEKEIRRLKRKRWNLRKYSRKVEKERNRAAVLARGKWGFYFNDLKYYLYLVDKWDKRPFKERIFWPGNLFYHLKVYHKELKWVRFAKLRKLEQQQTSSFLKQDFWLKIIRNNLVFWEIKDRKNYWLSRHVEEGEVFVTNFYIRSLGLKKERKFFDKKRGLIKSRVYKPLKEEIVVGRLYGENVVGGTLYGLYESIDGIVEKCRIYPEVNEVGNERSSVYMRRWFSNFKDKNKMKNKNRYIKKRQDRVISKPLLRNQIEFLNNRGVVGGWFLPCQMLNSYFNGRAVGYYYCGGLSLYYLSNHKRFDTYYFFHNYKIFKYNSSRLLRHVKCFYSILNNGFENRLALGDLSYYLKVIILNKSLGAELGRLGLLLRKRVVKKQWRYLNKNRKTWNEKKWVYRPKKVVKESKFIKSIEFVKGINVLVNNEITPYVRELGLLEGQKNISRFCTKRWSSVYYSKRFNDFLEEGKVAFIFFVNFVFYLVSQNLMKNLGVVDYKSKGLKYSGRKAYLTECNRKERNGYNFKLQMVSRVGVHFLGGRINSLDKNLRGNNGYKINNKVFDNLKNTSLERKSIEYLVNDFYKQGLSKMIYEVDLLVLAYRKQYFWAVSSKSSKLLEEKKEYLSKLKFLLKFLYLLGERKKYKRQDEQGFWCVRGEQKLKYESGNLVNMYIGSITNIRK